MKIDLFVHGVPYGESYWRKGDDQDYFGTFYDRSSDEVKCLIQVRMSEGKAYCYFNYLVNRDVLDSQGRAGSYFGMTLRIDSYCKDIVNVYRILDTLFNIYVMGKYMCHFQEFISLRSIETAHIVDIAFFFKWSYIGC